MSYVPTGPPLVGAGQRNSTRTASDRQDDAREVPPPGLAGAGVGVGVGVGVSVGEGEGGGDGKDEVEGVDEALGEVEGCPDDEDTDGWLPCEVLSGEGAVSTAVGGGLNT